MPLALDNYEKSVEGHGKEIRGVHLLVDVLLGERVLSRLHELGSDSSGSWGGRVGEAT